MADMAANCSAVSCAKTDGREISGHTSYHTAANGVGMGLANQTQIQANHNWAVVTGIEVQYYWVATWCTK
eukprot:1089800-Amphidinium_carterae.1